MSWKYVFNTNFIAIAGSSIERYLSIIKNSGYMFYTWNGNVYYINGDIMPFKVEDLF